MGKEGESSSSSVKSNAILDITQALGLFGFTFFPDIALFLEKDEEEFCI